MRAPLVLVLGCMGCLGKPDQILETAPACNASGWGAPRRIEEVSSRASEYGPYLSPDRLDLWFGSERDGGDALYHAHRDDPVATFDAPVRVSLLGATAFSEPFLSDDQLTIWFNRISAADFDIQVANRATSSAGFGAPAALP